MSDEEKPDVERMGTPEEIAAALAEYRRLQADPGASAADRRRAALAYGRLKRERAKQGQKTGPLDMRLRLAMKAEKGAEVLDKGIRDLTGGQNLADNVDVVLKISREEMADAIRKGLADPDLKTVERFVLHQIKAMEITYELIVALKGAARKTGTGATRPSWPSEAQKT